MEIIERIEENIFLVERYGQQKYFIDVMIAGKRHRGFRKTITKAKELRKKFKDIRDTPCKELFKFNSLQIADIISAMDALPAGETLLGCVERACEFSATKSPLEMQVDFLASKKRRYLSDDEYNHVKSRIENFCKTFENFKDATPTTLLEYLQKKGAPKTVLNWRGTISDFLEFTHKRGVIKTNPFSRIYTDDFAKPSKSAPGFVSVECARKLLEMLENHADKYVKHFALGMFAGLRVAEIGRLKESWIDYENKRIILPQEIVKTKQAWTLEALPSNLWAWLEKYKDKPITKPSNAWRDRHLKDFKLPHNFARHSFATYHLSLYHDTKRTIIITRHENDQTLKNRYWGALMPIEIATEYFNIMPSNVSVNAIGEV